MTVQTSRRDFLTDACGFTAGTVLLGPALAAIPHHASGTVQVALVGCGGRGSGAAENALSSPGSSARVVAMADVFEDKLSSSHGALTGMGLEGLDVPPERRFIGFEGYRAAMDCLKPGDLVILATPPAFRWVHFAYAIEKGLNVFMEKPLCVDGPSARKMLELAELSEKKNLKVGVGLMSRHSRAMEELEKRVRGGELGEIISQHGYRMQGPVASFRSTPAPAGTNELHHQIRRFHSFLWASGGAFNDFFIHIVDHLCWMKGAWPVKAHALGGRHYRTREDGEPYVDQNLDTYSVEYTYPDGTTFLFKGRNMDGCMTRFSSFMHGTKGSAIVSASSDCGLPSSIHRSHDLSPASMTWKSEPPANQRNPYQNEWDDLYAAIREDRPFNEARRGVEATIVCMMGRMAAHTGREISFNDVLACGHEFAPGVADLTLDSPAPLLTGPDGRYPVPQPGVVTEREY